MVGYRLYPVRSALRAFKIVDVYVSVELKARDEFLFALMRKSSRDVAQSATHMAVSTVLLFWRQSLLSDL